MQFRNNQCNVEIIKVIVPMMGPLVTPPMIMAASNMPGMSLMQ